jgi:hypothetical protein
MTTYGNRYHTVYLALESIAAGYRLPSRLILWLDDLQAFNNRPPAIRRLEARGLEVYLTDNYGPHKKYYPYLLSADRIDSPLVTADDDVLYSGWWLAGLIHAHDQRADAVTCYRAHVMELSQDSVKPYVTWKACHSSEPRFSHFATGSAGCLYPAPLLRKLKEAGTAFLELCPRADDIWLHANALRAGFKTQQVGSRSMNFPFIPGTQGNSLMGVNVEGGGNDRQIASTYTLQDIAKLAVSEI